jgi:hypothetical protein
MLWSSLRSSDCKLCHGGENSFSFGIHWFISTVGRKYSLEELRIYTAANIFKLFAWVKHCITNTQKYIRI